MSYTPPNFNAIEFKIENEYFPPLWNDIPFSTKPNILVVVPNSEISIIGYDVVLKGGQENDFPKGMCFDRGFRWHQNCKDFGSETRFVPKPISNNDHFNRGMWTKSRDLIYISSDYSYLDMDKIDEKTKIPYNCFEKINGEMTNFDYLGRMPFQDISSEEKWSYLEYFNHSVRFKKGNILPNDEHTKVAWGNNEKVYKFFHSLFGLVSEFADPKFRITWGPYWYSLLCDKKYYPPNDGYEIPFSLRETIDTGLSWEVNLYIGPEPNVRCPFKHKHSGIRDKYIIIPPPPTIVPRLWFYRNTNMILVKLLPDTSIDCYSVDIQTDIDSWCWDFSLTIPKKSYLDLISPELAEDELVLKEIEISVNNWKWRCMVESWSESRSFGQQSWTVRGRSPSVELSTPYGELNSSSNNSAIQSASLIDSILNLTGWSVEWGFSNLASEYSEYLNPVLDWEIPATAFNYVDKTKLQAIQYILEAVDGRIMTKHNCGDNRVFIIIPRYRHTPWQWSSLDISNFTLIHENACHEIGRTYNNLPRINNVVVSGNTFGGILNAKKSGSAGDKPTSMFSHDLITSFSAAKESAKNILSKSGMWTNHTLKLFSLDNFSFPTGYYPGVLLPGQLVSFTEDVLNKKGQVISTSIHGESVSGNRGLEVSQTIEFEEWIG